MLSVVNDKPTCPVITVPESTIHGWWKDKENLCDFVHTVDSTVRMKRKKARTAKDPQLDKVVFRWFVKDSKFVASKGWLHHFQLRHEITEVKVNGETRSGASTAASKSRFIM